MTAILKKTPQKHQSTDDDDTVTRHQASEWRRVFGRDQGKLIHNFQLNEEEHRHQDSTPPLLPLAHNKSLLRLGLTWTFKETVASPVAACLWFGSSALPSHYDDPLEC